jgi:hypothetical protein
VKDGLTNPYEGLHGSWFRGNIHGHSKEHSGCSSVPLETSIAHYRAAGSRFLAVTDHDHVTDLSVYRARHPDTVFLEGFEYSSSENVLFIGESVPPLHELPIAEALQRGDGLLTVICHPRPSRSRRYWTVEMILALRPAPVGIEVYNGHYSRRHRIFEDSNPLYTDTWDALLSAGCRVWGFANDDFHDMHDFGKAYNMVNVERLSASAVLDAMKAGRFYATTGLLLDEVRVEGGRMEVRLVEAAKGRFIGPEGRVLSEGEGSSFAYRTAGEQYVRFEAEGKAGRIFLQPFFGKAAFD